MRIVAERSRCSTVCESIVRLLTSWRTKPEILSAVAGGSARIETGSWLGPRHHNVYAADFCYICEKTGADSEDHVIAESFFGGITDELPRLLAHKKCNSGYGEAEEYVRNVLVQLDAATGTACEAARAKALGALRPPVPIARAQRKWEQQFRETGRDGERYTWLSENVDQNLWQRAVWKMTRGLCFWHTGRLCPGPEDYPWGTSTMREWPALERETFRFTNGDGFSVSAVVAGTDRTLAQGDLRLRFYQGVPVRVVFGLDLGETPL